jgi:hypothetical protein
MKTKFSIAILFILMALSVQSQVYTHGTRTVLSTVNELTPIGPTTRVLVRDSGNGEIKYTTIFDIGQNITVVETDPIFSASEAALFAAGDKAKLDGIEAGATQDQTAAEVPVVYVPTNYSPGAQNVESFLQALDIAVLPQPIPTGLEAIDEGGGGTGLVRVGSNATDRRNVGWNAIDLSSRFFQPVNIPGAGGYSSMVIGEDSFGSDYNDIVLAYYSTASASASGNGQRFIAGGSNDITGGTGSAAIGLALRNENSIGHVVVGTANLSVPGTNLAWNAADPVFTVGNGTFTTPAGRWIPIAPSNAFQVLKGGEVFAPSLDNTKIDNDLTGKILITKEFFTTRLSDVITTGVKDGGFLSPNVTTTLFDISDGFGYVVDSFTDPENPIVTKVVWSGLTALTPTHIAGNDLSSIAINSSGTVIQQIGTFTEEQSRDLIVLGTLVHIDNVNVTDVEDMSRDAGASYISTDMSFALGNINISGNNFTAASTDLTIKKSSGSTFRPNVNRHINKKNPHYQTSTAQDPVSFLYTYDDGSGGTVGGTLQTNIDPNNYDIKTGTLAAVPAGNNWTNQWAYFFPGSNIIVVRYGETVYPTLADAKAAAINVKPTIIGVDFDNHFIRTILSVQQGTTDLSNTANAFFTDSDKLGL